MGTLRSPTPESQMRHRPIPRRFIEREARNHYDYPHLLETLDHTISNATPGEVRLAYCAAIARQYETMHRDLARKFQSAFSEMTEAERSQTLETIQERPLL